MSVGDGGPGAYAAPELRRPSRFPPHPQRIDRAVFSSWIARWTCPRARA
jgi:hypothetical protein